MPLFKHHAWRDDPEISLRAHPLRKRIDFIFPGLVHAFYAYTAVCVVKAFLGYPYLFSGGHKISFTRLFGLGDPHPVMGGHHDSSHHDSHHGEHHAGHQAPKAASHH